MFDQKKYDIIYKLIATGRIVTVCFIKKDGTERIMNCRTGVKKHLKGGEASYDAASRGHIRVYDVANAKGYRTINTATVLWVKCDGREIHFG